MPVEVTLLDEQPIPFFECPNCGMIPFRAHIVRGLVQRWKRVWYWPFKIRPYCALICWDCGEIVGWEKPDKSFRWTREERVVAKLMGVEERGLF